MFIKGVISFIFGHLLGLGSVTTQVYVAPPAQVKASTTQSVVKNIASTSPKVATTTKKALSTTTPIKKAETITTKKEVPVPKKEEVPLPDFGKVNAAARQTIVNILCSTKGNELSPISGTGVIISEKGIILTNAHIGQYLLLKNFREKDSINCVIRTGSPAYPQYNTELVYISPTWIKDNSTLLKSSDPKGTGENDFAFLRITEKVDGSKLPDGFAYVVPDIREYIEKGEPVLLISYPAGFLGGLSILQDLNITSSVTNIQDFFTYKQNTIDLISVGGTVVSQKGSSGGAVIDKYVTLLGLISTSSNGNSTKDRDLRAITLAHINRSMKTELGIDLASFLDQNPAEFAKTFASTTAPLLTKIITDELSK